MPGDAEGDASEEGDAEAKISPKKPAATKAADGELLRLVAAVLRQAHLWPEFACSMHTSSNQLCLLV